MTIYALGPFRLDTRSDLLLLGDEPAALGRRAVALLRVLIEQHGALVLKDALIEAAWPGQIVEESNLTVQIAALRRVLAEAPGGERWIETMPRRGYRFVAPVVAPADDAATEQGAAAPPPRIDAAPLAPAEPERRQVTALSCELISFSGRADGSRLEDWREAISAFQRHVAQTVGRHGGFVVSHLGAVGLALFGYPEAHEHDAERAVRAGLELCATVGALTSATTLPMRCRAGIATDLAIIGDLGEGGTLRDQEIIGDSPNRAGQLRMSSQPDGVAVDSNTRQLIGKLFECRDLGAIDGTEASRAWHVTRESVVASRFEALRGTALTRLIGRDEEVGLLLRLWARAKAGDGQLVLISGEPGLGKSRLAAELEDHLRDEPCLRLRYFCSPHHQDSALFPFVDQLRRAAGFAGDEPPAARLAKLEALLARAELPGEDMRLLAELLSLPASADQPPSELSSQRKKERTLQALIGQLAGLARRQPVLMILEDAHWIDATSRDLLDLIVERARDLPVLLVVTLRPEFQPPWTGEPRVTMLALNRLDRRDRISLAAQIAGKALPKTVVEAIADRTDGVPLFVEEVTKSVLESGLLRAEADRYVLDGVLPPFAIPTTLYASLLARLDRPASMRLVAQTGAAIGREFSYALVRAVSRLSEEELRSALARLVASELVFQRGAPPEAVYSFKHALVQDVAYGSLLQGARRQLHARIAEALEAQSPELMESQPELFARHYTEAGHIEKSVDAWGKAGQLSAERTALAEAAAHYQKALNQLALLPENPDRLRRELELHSALGASLRFAKGQAAPETGEAYARARKLWDQLGSPSAFLQVPYGQAMSHMLRAELDQVCRLGEDLLHLSGHRDDSAGLVLGHSACGQGLLLAGEFALARKHLEQVLALYDPVTHRTLVHQTGSHPLMTQAFLGNVLLSLGFPEQALARSNSAIADARILAHRTSLAVSLVIAALQLSLTGDDRALAERAEQLSAVATEQSLPFYRLWAAIYRSWATVRAGDVAQGLARLRDAVAAYRATGAQLWMPRFTALLAAAYEIAGQLEAAVAQLDDALRTMERTGERWLAAELNRYKALLVLRQGQTQPAEDLYREALAIARKQEARFWELRAATGLARLCREQGRHAEARDLLVPIHGWFSEGFDAPDLKEAKALLATLR